MNAYDQIAYLNRPYAQTHPDRLAVLGRLYGMDTPPAGRARVLDLGASEGGNIIPMAISLPNAEFIGIDLAAIPVERGNQVIRDLGLTNVRLLQMDLLEMDKDLGKFDYIIAHGLYAWTPPVVRDRILKIARDHLTRTGIAFVSYNAYPGGHLRKVLREAMLLHIGDTVDPAKRLELARSMLQLLVIGRPTPDGFDRAFAAEAAELLKLNEGALFHDYLGDIYEPSYLKDFVAHAAKHQLKYVADAGVMDAANPNLSPEVISAVSKSAGNRVEREQYLDVLRLRRFRQSLVCRAEVALEEEWSASRAAGLFAAANCQETEDGKFTAHSGVSVTTNHPGVIAFLRKLTAAWPQAEPIDAAESELALALLRGSMVELRTSPGISVRAGERPTASPFARYQARRGDLEVSTLNHRSLPIGVDQARRFLTLLDGTRDRAALARDTGVTIENVETPLKELERNALLVA